MLEMAVSVCLILGSFFMLVAALGVLRFADVYQRLHASSKAATLGVMFILAAAAMESPGLGTVFRCIMAIVFFVLTAPVGAHLIARAAYNAGDAPDQETLSDEFADDQRDAAQLR